MATAASGTLSKLLANLRTLIAASSTFQTWVDEESAAAAANHIYLSQTAPTGEGVRPFAVIGFDEGQRAEAIAGGTRNYFTIDGGLWVAFEADITDDDDYSEEYEFTNQVGAIMAEMEQLAGAGGYLNMTGYVVESISRATEGEAEAENEFFQGIVSVQYWGKGA